MISFALLLLNTYYISLTHDPIPSAYCPVWTGSCYKVMKAASESRGQWKVERMGPTFGLAVPHQLLWLLAWMTLGHMSYLLTLVQPSYVKGARLSFGETRCCIWSLVSWGLFGTFRKGLAPWSCLGLKQGEYFSKFELLCLLLRNMCPETRGQIGES